MPETQLLSGKAVSAAVYSELNSRIAALKEKGLTPGLAVILVGADPASQVYVRSKERRFAKMGLYSETFRFDDDLPESDLIEKIRELNDDHNFHGLLVQLPLSQQISEQKIIETINPEKDVDGFHPVNLGLMTAGVPRFISCTPKGILRILKHYDIETSGKHVVVCGRSNIVGRPISVLLSLKTDYGNAIVTVIHSRTPDLQKYTRQADILIAALGQPEMITGDFIKAGACVIDVGINRVEDAAQEKGYRMVGDVQQSTVMGKASYLTPVPGGVGLMTIAMLVENTVEAAELGLQ
ncbi:MAG: bifunctional 5,10-methylene-tetrahydrofolate dehydrogenase/5,10-methylene-tetrahydrofolate cyclohydrolase [Candidatus Marinimicrobia bacterium]|nr:bifunctional 5,10-methylene-tetrahydrofolate dehydrogenase/5,10-methylene-tetrahydrofolate cyclohydrolase [Candidatus Neomarinimicrobiota bacterium]